LTKKHHKCVLLATILLLSAVYFPSSVFAEQSSADSAIASAKQQIVTCYNAVKAAEAAGANISSLTSILNGAGLLLSQSELAYSKSDFATAQNLAVQTTQSLSNFVSEANVLRDTAAQLMTLDFYYNIVGSIAGTIVVIVVGFVVWRFVKKRFMSLEVQNDGLSGL
jgi:hypothetical protein